ncbi:MAG TPA: Holliday junction resolvase RuvX [Epulopiscium sp.]|nr:Holliday junction resolvase RuvX [Candidatus Epulonipiscium sp.]
MRILGLDFGSKTVGVSLSDPFGWTAQGVETIFRKQEENIKPTIARIKELCSENQVKTIVLGFPKNMNNTVGERCEKTLKFQKKLEAATQLKVELWDERLSTLAAENILLEADVSRQKRKTVIDKMAAVYILQGYLDSKSL